MCAGTDQTSLLASFLQVVSRFCPTSGQMFQAVPVVEKEGSTHL